MKHNRCLLRSGSAGVGRCRDPRPDPDGGQAAQDAALAHNLGPQARGQAPTYLDLARAEGLPPEEARQALRDLMAAVPGGWQHPGTDLIVAYSPFNNLPTWHRITVAGEQKWTAQCGFDALVVTHVFPDTDVEIDSLCRDCGESVRVTMRDGAVVRLDPPEAVGHVNLPVARWFDDFAAT